MVNNNLPADHIIYTEITKISDVDADDIKNTILSIKNTSLSIDVGALCYLQRSSERRKRGRRRVFSIGSYSAQRAEKIAASLKILHELTTLNARPRTIYTKYAAFAKFLDWTDEQAYPDPLVSHDSAESSIKSYLSFLNKKVLSNELSPYTADDYISGPIFILSKLLDIEFRKIDKKILFNNGARYNPRLSPAEIDQARQLNFNLHTFDQLYFFILDNAEFPWKLHLPEYVAGNDQYHWIFPIVYSVGPGSEHSNIDQGSKYFAAYDFKNGKLFEQSEIENQYSVPRSALAAIKHAHLNINRANSDPRSHHRISYAQLAHDIFVDIFYATTGMSPSCAAELRWAGVYETISEAKGFKSIKYRAQGKEVYFSLGSNFVPYFNKFLKIRDFLIGNHSSEYLFIRVHQQPNKEPLSLTSCTTDKTHNRLLKMYSGYPCIRPSMWRAAKSDWAISKTDLHITATLLQNVRTTASKHYGRGSRISNIKNVGVYLKNLEIKTNATRNDANIAIRQIGNCLNFEKPLRVGNDSLFPLDCKQIEGCFSCKHHFVIPDEIDIRKLHSAKRCFISSKILSHSNQHWAEIFTPVISKIDETLREISQLSPEHKKLVTDIDFEVNQQGLLSSFWMAELDLLRMLGEE